MIYSAEISTVKQVTTNGRAYIEQHPSVIGTGITHSNITSVDNDTNPGYQIIVYLKDTFGLQAVPHDINGVRVVYRIIGLPRPGGCSVGCYGKCCECTGMNATFSAKERPLKPGASIGPAKIMGVVYPNDWRCMWGTLGGFPTKDGTPVILSNNHVIALDIPQHNRMYPGDGIIQPGSALGGNIRNDVVGHLAGWVPLSQGTSGNTVDAAYATVASGISIEYDTLCRYRINYGVSPVIGMDVIKTGSTSGCTNGKIESIDATWTCDYSSNNDGSALVYFSEQIITSSGFSSNGDSGSVVVTNDGNNNAVGLLFSLSGDGTTALNTIANVERALGVTFGQSPTQPTQPTGTQPTGTQPTQPGECSPVFINITQCPPQSVNIGDSSYIYFSIGGGITPYYVDVYVNNTFSKQFIYNEPLTNTWIRMTWSVAGTRNVSFVITDSCNPRQSSQSGYCSVNVIGGTQPTGTQPTGTVPPTKYTCYQGNCYEYEYGEFDTIEQCVSSCGATQPTGTQPTGTQPITRYTCYQGNCYDYEYGEYDTIEQCVSECGVTQPTGTQPTGTQPTGTHPTGTQPTGTQPTTTQPTGTLPTGCKVDEIKIIGKCIKKNSLLIGAGIAGVTAVGYTIYKHTKTKEQS